jgi:hypothetical protein
MLADAKRSLPQILGYPNAIWHSLTGPREEKRPTGT